MELPSIEQSLKQNLIEGSGDVNGDYFAYDDDQSLEGASRDARCTLSTQIMAGIVACALVVILIATTTGGNESRKAAVPVNPGTSCQDESGEMVEWWFIYKEADSYKYKYVTSLDVAWRASEHLINSPKSLLGTHMGRLAREPWFVMYNGQPLEGEASSEHGHMKGAVGGYYWIPHSVPRCCWKDGVYDYPASGKDKVKPLCSEKSLLLPRLLCCKALHLGFAP